jgi:hypothetical protein
VRTLKRVIAHISCCEFFITAKRKKTKEKKRKEAKRPPGPKRGTKAVEWQRRQPQALLHHS